MPIAWDPATMSSGIPTVDQQHRQLIEWLNDLLAAMSAEQGGPEVGPSWPGWTPTRTRTSPSKSGAW
jgi:hypothetical protein